MLKIPACNPSFPSLQQVIIKSYICELHAQGDKLREIFDNIWSTSGEAETACKAGGFRPRQDWLVNFYWLGTRDACVATTRRISPTWL